MANEAPRTDLPYPAEFADPWYPDFESMALAIDASLFALFEDRNTLMLGGGVLDWNSTTGLLSWSDDIVFWTPSTGIRQILATKSATINDTEALYVDLARGATAAVVLTSAEASYLSFSDTTIVIALRGTNDLYLRSGLMLAGTRQGGLTPVWREDKKDAFVGNASDTVFTLATQPSRFCIPQVYADGVLQDDPSEYTYTAGVVTFGVAPAVGVKIDVRSWI